ncbi:hypothetical protein [Ferirhizobium litorale]|uniref:Uncharacterized protein n=1 Tax=Ferirhizobium litorale TaxID=2927786 RepID=A0AAE3U0W3_9HYPH|nr:hypothetical protein [Fererhizobium litorale]MDI7921746.1 hypothetical protein [Fererhizobium litorale]
MVSDMVTESQFKALADACTDATAKALAELRVERQRLAEQHRAQMAEIESRFASLSKGDKPRYRVRALTARTTL